MKPDCILRRHLQSPTEHISPRVLQTRLVPLCVRGSQGEAGGQRLSMQEAHAELGGLFHLAETREGDGAGEAASEPGA